MSNGTRRQTLFVLVFIVVVILFVVTFRMGVVRGDSMLPTYVNGQVVLMRRWGKPLKRGDVVVVKKDNDMIIKRVYRLPGEEVTDPIVLNMTYQYNLQDYYEQPFADKETGRRHRLFVPEGYLVILGDNPRVSEDSRLFGPVPQSDVLGIVVNAPTAPNGPTVTDTPPDNRFRR
jgi:signal peptidase I